MCLLTYIPYANGGFVVTSNRDEHINRKRALAPKRLKVADKELICPIDPVSKGTWIGTSSCYTVVLLNGGLEKHIATPPYKMSRGQVVLECIKYNKPIEFYEQFDFSGFEPFTLVIFYNNQQSPILEIVWTGTEKIKTEIDNTQTRIWSSSTLYNREARQKREAWFTDFLTENKDEISADDLLELHHCGGSTDKENGFLMARENGIRTVSMTQIELKENTKMIQYNDLVQGISKSYRIY
jgi:uncharacterized protein with NRDE domain